YLSLPFCRRSKDKSRFFLLVLSGFCSLVFDSCKKEFETNFTASQNISNSTVSNSQPNIILFLGDDIGYEIPTCDGGQSYTTPNIDKMAQAGLRFTQCYGAADCCPSRLMLLTGKYNFRNYVSWGVMDRSQRTFANMLQHVGYTTCYAGK